MASNGALAERNERVKYARTLGIEKPHTLKKDALEAAIKDAEKAALDNIVHGNRRGGVAPCGSSAGLSGAWHDVTCAACKATLKTDEDPFDDIDPTLEGDHLTEDVITAETVGEAVSLRESIREAWLIDAATEIKALYRQAGYPQIDAVNFLISTGFPQGNVRKIIGQCHHADCNDGVAHIFINPTQDDTMRVLEIVAHEMAHAMGFRGHTGEFRKAAIAVGLVGAGGKDGKGFTSTNIGDDALPVFKDVAEKLGPYPHTKVNLAAGGVKKQTTRMLKAMCTGRVWDDEAGDYVERGCELSEGGDGYVIRLTKKWAELGLPTCPCGGEMILEEKDGE
jgi:hypothetical protein